MKKLLLLLIFVIPFSVFTQTSYYVSSTTGNNLYFGNSPGQAWADFTNFDMMLFGEGDTIFIKCGDIIEDSLRINGSGNSSNPIVITSYGSGSKPIISGSKKLTGWTGGSVKTTPSSDEVFGLVVNESQLEFAKYPDSGFLTADNTTSTTGFVDTDLTASPDYTGANVCVHTSLWTWESTGVSVHSGNSVSFSTPTQEPTVAPDFDGFGYFFFDRPDLITLPGEWSWESGTVHLMPPTGVDPEIDDVQGIVLNTGIRVIGNSDFIKIENIEFKNFKESGIKAQHGLCNNIEILNCTFRNCIEYGIYVRGTDHLISNNEFQNINGRALFATNTADIIINGNHFNKTGMYRNSGVHADDNLAAVVVQSSDGAHIHHNVIDSTGYSAIRCDGTNALVERNIISNYMMLLSDGGAVKTYGSFSQYITYKNNLIFNGKYNHDGTPTSSEHIQSASLYFDFDANHCELSDNVVYGDFTTGIFLNGGANNCMVKNNVLYGGESHIILNDRDNPDSLFADTIIFNKCFALNEETVNMRINSNNNFLVGYIDSNYLFNPYSDVNIAELHGTIGGMPGIQYSFSGWQSVLGYDIDSKESFVDWLVSENYSEIFVNDTDSPINFPLGTTKYLDLDSNIICDEITVAPYYAEILINTGENCATGFIEEEKYNFEIFPNPAGDLVNILFASGNTPESLSIYSPEGTLLFSQKMLTSTNHQIDISEFSSGIYFITIQTNQKSYTQRLIKK